MASKDSGKLPSILPSLPIHLTCSRQWARTAKHQINHVFFYFCHPPTLEGGGERKGRWLPNYVRDLRTSGMQPSPKLECARYRSACSLDHAPRWAIVGGDRCIYLMSFKVRTLTWKVGDITRYRSAPTRKDMLLPYLLTYNIFHMDSKSHPRNPR